MVSISLGNLERVSTHIALTISVGELCELDEVCSEPVEGNSESGEGNRTPFLAGHWFQNSHEV